MRASLMIFCCLFSLCRLMAQDTLLLAKADTFQSSVIPYDSLLAENNARIPVRIFLTDTTGKIFVSDIQQMVSAKNHPAVFLLLLVLLGILTYVKTAFGKDLEGVILSVTNRSTSSLLMRSQPGELSFSSLLLHANFIVALSVAVHFFLSDMLRKGPGETTKSLLLLMILFTFFYVFKILAVRMLGGLFDMKEYASEYIYNLSIVTKTLGMTLLPALFILYASPKAGHEFVYAISFALTLFAVLLFVWRGLSTVYKIMYRSVYYFFIYVCVMEVSPILLFFKLLTKTIA